MFPLSTSSLFTKEETDQNYDAQLSDHDYFKEIVVHAFINRAGVSLVSDRKIEGFSEYIFSMNSYMFFTADNLKQIATYINESVDTRDLIFNVTDHVMLEYLGDGRTLDSIIDTVSSVMEVNKNATDSSKKLYDVRIAHSLMIDKDTLKDLLVHNTYLLVCYYVSIYSHAIISGIDDIVSSK